MYYSSRLFSKTSSPLTLSHLRPLPVRLLPACSELIINKERPVTIAVDAKAAGFEEVKLARVGEHLRQSYIEPEKIPGCQVLVSRHGIPAYF